MATTQTASLAIEFYWMFVRQWSMDYLPFQFIYRHRVLTTLEREANLSFKQFALYFIAPLTTATISAFKVPLNAWIASPGDYAASRMALINAFPSVNIDSYLIVLSANIVWISAVIPGRSRTRSGTQRFFSRGPSSKPAQVLASC